MAHVGFRSPRVGRYGVDVSAIDAVAETALALDPAVDLYIVDEIGKMECLSQRFIGAMRALLDSEKRVLASLARSGGGFIREVRELRYAELVELTLRNRDALVGRIITWIGSTRG
jgi:nucleoside-triphosphatase